MHEVYPTLNSWVDKLTEIIEMGTFFFANIGKQPMITAATCFWWDPHWLRAQEPSALVSDWMILGLVASDDDVKTWKTYHCIDQFKWSNKWDDDGWWLWSIIFKSSISHCYHCWYQLPIKLLRCRWSALIWSSLVSSTSGRGDFPWTVILPPCISWQLMSWNTYLIYKVIFNTCINIY